MAGHTAADMEQELRRRGLTLHPPAVHPGIWPALPVRGGRPGVFPAVQPGRDGACRQELEARLEPSPWPDYPLYLPNPKPLCLLAIPAGQLKEGSHG